MASLHERILVTLLSLLMLVAATTTLLAAQTLVPPPQAKPGCREKCGDLTIPYPFGLGEACSMRPEFTITCDESTTAPPSANFTNSTFTFPITITNFSLVDGELQVMQDIARNCYDEKGKNTISSSSSLELPPPYTISTKNNIFTLGCNVLAVYEQGVAVGRIGATAVLCMDILGNELTEFCIGVGCAKTSIPSGLQNISIGLASFYGYNASDPWESNYKCSYAFIVEEGNFTFAPKTSFQLLNTTIQQLPVAVNWAIGDEPCAVAKNPTDYSCKENTICVDRSTSDETAAGYICRCLPGYEGNPYLGCRDIDECATSSSDPCTNGKCVNSPPGNYSCKCNKGFRNQDHMTCIPYSVLFDLKLSFGIGSSLGLILLAIAAWWLVQVIKKRKTKKRKEEFFKQNGGLVLQQQLSSGDQANVEKIRLFNSRELEKATDQFSINRILGQGGQGTVYKGMLMDGQIVAVKKSKIVNGGEVQQFINEIVILSQINHRNVVKLLGCCLETEIPLLVYEFLPNGTLAQYIHDQDEEFPLTWGTRLRVSTEVAGALSYLHSAASIPIYHRDIKSTNILLDAKYRAKIADFGTSRSISIDQTHLTTQVHGTFGYLDPEYFQSSQFTEKSDVYSFGVVLAELLTGQKPISMMRSQESRSLATHFLLSMEQDRLFDILDAQVMQDGSKEEIIAVANLAQRCINLNGRKRPTMKAVAAELEGVRLAVKDADHVQQNLVEEGDVRTHEITTEAYWGVVSTSPGPFTDGGSAGSSSDVQPLMYYNTQ